LALKKSVQGWVRKADEDMFMAKIARDSRNELTLYPIAFHCQQAVEKLLKAFLTHHGKKFRFKHDILYLLKLARKIDPSLDDIFKPARVLTPYAIAARYPDAIVKHALTLAKVDEFIALTDKCHEEILSRIHDKGPLL
jgi:HEPN domain-containing protein